LGDTSVEEERWRAAHSGISVRARAVAYLTEHGATSTKELFDALRISDPSVTRDEVADVAWWLEARGSVNLEDMPPPVRSLGQFLRLWERTLWLYISLALSLATILVIYVFPAVSPFLEIRWAIGSFFLLFLPGYVMLEASFPTDVGLGSTERFALSIGLSLVLVMLVGLLLNFTVGGIQLTPIIVSISLLTFGLAVVAFARRYRISRGLARRGRSFD
jgi:hypothetical protein